MLERKCSVQISQELARATVEGDFDKVKNLVENCDAVITNLSYISAVQYNRTEILQYFLEKNSTDSLYALNAAIREGNVEAIEIVISFWKKNKGKNNFDVDSAILSAISVVIEERQSVALGITVPNLNAKALDIIRLILKTYDE